MRPKMNQLLGLLSLLLLASPVWARTDSAKFHADHDVTIGGKQLKAGDYELKIVENDSNLSVTQDGKLVAQVPVHWIQLQDKAHATEVELTENRVTEVDFAGKTQAVQIQSN
jgi:hypothetical protein